MNFKSLLLGTAGLIFATSLSSAAGANILAEPEPVEFVRVCDTYGAGFFYIPGTETCLKVGGYFRYEIYVGQHDYLSSLARFAPNFTVQSETELGTLTGYAELEADYFEEESEFVNRTSLYAGYIQLGGLLVGKNDNPYSRFLDFAGPTIFEGRYAWANPTEISYTFDAGNGFSAIIAAVDSPENSTWDTNFEGGVKYAKDWGSIGAIAGYDGVAESWGARATARFKVPSTSIDASLHFFYSSPDNDVGMYTILDPRDERTKYSVLAGLSTEITPRFGLASTIQYFDTRAWEVSFDAPFKLTEGFAITPEVVYANTKSDKDVWTGLLRFQRDF